MRRLLLVLVLALAGGPFGAVANAAVSATCTLEGTLTFDPPLTTTTASGTISLSYTYACTDVYTSGQYGFRGGSISGGWETYTGDCKLAILSGGSLVGILVGGADYIHVGPATGTVVPESGTWALEPDKVCDETTAYGPSVGTAVWPY
jgi:hypothetical protein